MRSFGFFCKESFEGGVRVWILGFSVVVGELAFFFFLFGGSIFSIAGGLVIVYGGRFCFRNR